MVNQYTGLAALNANLVRTNYDKKLQRRAIPKSIYANLMSDVMIYERQELQIPDDVIFSVTGKANKAFALRVGLKMEPQGNILRGNTVALGTEIAPVVRDATLYRNNYRMVFQDVPGYGENRVDADYYRLYEEHVKDLGNHAEAEKDLEIHMALIERWGWNLQAGSTVNVCVPQWNPNIYVCGLPRLAQQPVFHPTNATYTNRIVAAMNTASGGTGTFPQTPGQMLSATDMDQMVRLAFRRRMWPLRIGGQQAFILTVSQLQAQRYATPEYTNTLMGRFIIRKDMDEPAANWIGMIGKYVSAAGADIYIVRDDRLPTLLPGGTAEPFSLQALYMWPTTNDLRQLDNALIRDASTLHGRAAIALNEPEAEHTIRDDYDYLVRNGIGYAGVRGYQRLEFDSTPADAAGANRYYYGSMTVICGRNEGS